MSWCHDIYIRQKDVTYMSHKYFQSDEIFQEVINDVGKFGKLTADAELISRETSLCCCLRPVLRKVSVKRSAEDILKKLQNETFQQRIMMTGCCYDSTLTNVLYAKTPCCDLNVKNFQTATMLCSPLMACGLGMCCCGSGSNGCLCIVTILAALGAVLVVSNGDKVCGVREVDSMNEINSLWSTMKMLERKIPQSNRCCGFKAVDDAITILAAKYTLLSKMDYILQKMVQHGPPPSNVDVNSKEIYTIDEIIERKNNYGYYFKN